MNGLTTPLRLLQRGRVARRGGSIALLIAGLSLVLAPSAFAAGGQRRFPKLDEKLEDRAVVASSVRTHTYIVSLASPGSELPNDLKKYARRGKLDAINAHIIDLPDSELGSAATRAAIGHVHDGEVRVTSSNFRTSIESGTFFVRHEMGITGSGVKVAMVDSGVASHPDLENVSRLDCIGGACVTPSAATDEFGHGTHLAGIIAGSGAVSTPDGMLAGMAPGVSLVSLKALGADGSGSLTDVVVALEWLVQNARANGIRVVNLSLGTPVTKSYWEDPLTLLALELVKQNIVVVVAAGNQGEDNQGNKTWGTITSPGNAPWVITVGASSTEGTLTRGDDTLAGFSSLGPTRGDFAAKPDLVASGVGTVSTAAAGSTLYQSCLVAETTCLINSAGHKSTGRDLPPYMAMTGTSVAAPVVTGTVAQMLQANPNLTPNLVKAILQYTAEIRSGYTPLEEGAGFLNALGAVRLAQFYRDPQPGSVVPVEPIWSQQFFWGNYRITGGIMVPTANAWADNIVWGTFSNNGDNIVWGTACGRSNCGDNIVWGTASGDNIVWGTARDADNIVWGTAGGDNIVWGTARYADNIVWGTVGGDNIVWGTVGGGDNIVWGTVGGDNIVWGTVCGGADCGNIVWGTASIDNIVWGTASNDNIVWGTVGVDNIVWGTVASDNIVWGTVGGDNIVWGTVGGDNIVWGTVGGDNIVWGTVADENIVWGTSLRGKNRDTQGVNVVNMPYQWFQVPRNAEWWIQQEFVDGSRSRHGGEVSASTKSNRPRHQAKSEREGK